MDASDAGLLERWRDGDRAAGEVLFDRYYEVVERFFVNKVQVGIADLVQDTFKACVEARDRVNDSSKFRPYLFSIAYNVLRNYLRKKCRSNEEIELDQVTIHSLDAGPFALLVEREEQRLLLEGLRNIPIELQIVLELYYWESLKIAEIAEILAIPEGTAKTRLHRAREGLKKAIVTLADSPELLRSTLDNLDSWARQCRQVIGR